MSYFKPKNWLDVLWHVLTIIALFTIVLLFVFKVFLPSYTHHGEVINVPSIENMSIEEATAKLEEYQLQWVVTDTVYSPHHHENAVVVQNPKAKAEVKQNRKVYITLNRSGKPTWTFKEDFIQLLRKRSLSDVKYRLDSIGVAYRLRTIYRRNVKDYVHEVFYHGDTLRAGTKVEIGGRDKLTLQYSTGEADPSAQFNYDAAVEPEKKSDDDIIMFGGDDDEGAL